jgi:predicted SPOUT superfamily RNA methylase MTH1
MRLTWINTFSGQSVETSRHPIAVIIVLVRLQLPGLQRQFEATR